MSIASKLEYLDGTKDYIRQCIQQKGVVVDSSTTFRQYGDKILQIETEQHPPDWGGEGGEDGETKLTTGVATATGQDFVLSPPEGYNGFSSVNVTGDYNLKPENIAEGITIYGVTGTMQVPKNTSIIPSVYLDLFEEAKKYYNGDYKNLMILESNDTIAFGFMLDGFNVDNYDSENTEFYASKWVYVAHNKKTGAWKVEPWENSTSNGNSYIRNIRYCDTYIYYGNLLIYPFFTDNTQYPDLPDYGEGEMFSFEIQTTAASVNLDTIIIRGIGSIIVDYGDGNRLETVSNDVSRDIKLSNTYKNAGSYIISVNGYITYFSGYSNRTTKILTPLPSSISSSLFGNLAVFNGCSLLESIPVDTFSKLRNESVRDLQNLFQYTLALKSIPSGIFNYSAFSSVVAMNSIFGHSGISSVPEDLFYAFAKQIQTASSAFFSCGSITQFPTNLFKNFVSLVSVSSLCSSSGIKTIPNNFLSDCKKLSSAVEMCRAARYLYSIPDTIFPKQLDDGVSLNCSKMFWQCSALMSVSESFFKNLPEVSNVSDMFRDCSGIVSKIPEIWDESQYGTKFTSIPHDRCFSGCTSAPNYDNIPQGWK